MMDGFTSDEFRQLTRQRGARERSIVEERLRTRYARERFEHFVQTEVRILRAILEGLIPQSEGLDLAGFVDWAADRALGRGDRAPEAMPDLELFHAGLAATDVSSRDLHGTAFDELAPALRDHVLRSMLAGDVHHPAWRTISSGRFVERLYSKALHGYFAHPLAWMRIGFPGAGYPAGYLWVSLSQVRQRHAREPGWDRL
ncbi:MAG TPA: gluconate 2-dehydrogenase subunit 3 family protein [Candidatus Binatia bacterium]|nr:gluconate 2-dehydrogenase subunit 3 family protein [Candidatus Binatia bacterium]